MGHFAENKNEGVWLHFLWKWRWRQLYTKLRNRLQNKTLDTLCLLCAHYAHKNWHDKTNFLTEASEKWVVSDCNCEGES